MGNSDPFSPKAISKRIKAKGLQRLKWYCQMCEKQCRDENGFKCHCLSEGHQRQMKLFGETPEKFLYQYSSQFQHDFLHTLAVRFGTKRVLANAVYQEYIRDRGHVHMNATRWNTLTEFCYAMQRAELLQVDDASGGLFITWVDNSPAALARQHVKEQKEQEERREQHVSGSRLQLQLQQARASSADQAHIPEAVDIPSAAAKIPISFNSAPMQTPAEDPMWLRKGIRVRILNSEVGAGRYHGKEGVILRVVQDYLAEVRPDASLSELLHLDQEDLEPLAPSE
jgi:DNA/RNA-binding protein KIN17